MKLAVSSLKNLDYKQLAIDHGEKVVIAFIGLLIASVLYGSNWKATDKSPSELKEKAEQAATKIEEQPWPATAERKKAGLGQGNQLADKVALLLTPVSASGFSIQPMNPPLHPDKMLISMPRWLPVQHLIADSGFADLSLRPGTPPLDEGFIRKEHKEKESKAKARRERMERMMKQREAALMPKTPKKDENDDSIPEELRPKSPVAADAGGGFGIGRRSGRMGPGGGGSKKRKTEEVAPTPVRQVAAKPVGRGYPFVAVRGIFPLADQVKELARATGSPSSEKDVQSLVQFRDFKLERQTRSDRPGADPWNGPWEAVDRDVVLQLLENDVSGYAPETVLDGLIDGHICMPYPDRVVGQWDRFATHPDIKEFTLTDDEVQAQVEYEMKLIEKIKAQDEQNKKPADKRGFMTLTKDMRSLNAKAQQVPEGDEKSIRRQILEKLQSGSGDKDQMTEQLEEFVRTRATPVDHYVLFRYLDLKVEPGKTYRYRVKLVVTNPFHERRVEEVTDPAIIEGEDRETEFSEPTAPVSVPDKAQFFVKRVDWRPGRPSLPSADVDIFQWFAETGTVVNKVLTGTQIGQLIGGRKPAEVLRPADNVFDNESVLFSTKDALLDVYNGFSFDSSLHKDVLDQLKSVPSIKRSGLNAPDEVVVVDENGEIHVIDGQDQKADYDKTKTHYDLQNKAFDSLRKPAGGDDDLTNDKRSRRMSKKDRQDPRRSFGRGRMGGGGKGGNE